MPLAPANYGPDNNIFFNGAADYTVSGLWTFLQQPNIPGGGGFDPNAPYTTTGNWSNSGAWAFTGNFSVELAATESITLFALSSIVPPAPAGEIHILSENNTLIGSTNGSMQLFTEDGNIKIEASGLPSVAVEVYGQDHILLSCATGTGFIELIAATETRVTAGDVRLQGGQLIVESMSTQAAAVVAPTTSPPAGYSHVIVNNTTGQLYRMT